MGEPAWVVLAAVVVAGFVRGMTGFGGSMVMTPLLSLMLGPVKAVIVALILEIAAAFVMLPKVITIIDFRLLAFLTVPACLTVPIGSYFLLTVDPEIARRTISAVVVILSTMLITGVRYTGATRPTVSAALGMIVGLLLGSTGIGGPPAILYLLSGSEPQSVKRANLTGFATTISMIGLLMLGLAGAITIEFMAYAASLVVPFMMATWCGGLLFECMAEVNTRRFALIFMLVIGAAGLLI